MYQWMMQILILSLEVSSEAVHNRAEETEKWYFSKEKFQMYWMLVTLSKSRS